MGVRPWSPDDRPGAVAVGGAGGGRRREKVVRGTGTVTPRQPLVLHENGHTEELLPRISRFGRDHPVVVANPSALEPTDREDAETTHSHRRLLERTLATLGTTTRTATPSRRERFRLPTASPREWRLKRAAI